MVYSFQDGIGNASGKAMEYLISVGIAISTVLLSIWAYLKGSVNWNEKVPQLVPLIGKGCDSKIKKLNKNYEVGCNVPLQFDTGKNANNFYDLVTKFYEYGWGTCFHFGTRYKGESFRESILRHDYNIALACALKSDDHILDLGCGVGGPARNICRFVGCRFTCVTINRSQVARASELTPVNLPIKFLETDFTNLTAFSSASFDKAINVESLVHTKHRLKVFKEVFRVLKPGGLLFSYEWVLNDKYNPKNSKHVEIKRGIEHGNALPDLRTAKDVKKLALEAGFEVVESYDMAVKAAERYGENNIPWYAELEWNCSLSGFRKSWFGRALTMKLLMVMEAVGLAPAGSTKTAEMLEVGAANLVASGKIGFFTPMHILLLRKPLASEI